MNKNKNLTIEYSDCPDQWMYPFIDEIISHIELPDKEIFLDVFEITERSIDMSLEIIAEDDTDEDEECGEFYVHLRYWIDEEWPDFCVSYCLYIDEDEKENGAYQIVQKYGKGKCIPIEDD